MRSISNVVDVTNYVMQVYGSPLHVFDRSKLHEGPIVVRHANDGRSCGRSTARCAGSTRATSSSPTARRRLRSPRSWAGSTREVAETTTEVLLEAANFEPIGILETSERLALRTEGSNRWEKGVDPYLAEPAAVMASRMIVDLSGAELVGAVDINQGLPARPVVTLRPERTTRSSGSTSPHDEQRAILERLDFEVADDWQVTVPTFRARDVTREIDLVEEVARVVLDRVPKTMPLRREVAGHLSRDQRLRRIVEDVLVGAGYTEAYTWSLVGADPDPRAIRLPAADGRRAGDAAHDAARGARRGGAGQRRRGQPPDRALRARAGVPPVAGAAAGGALAGRRHRRGRLRRGAAGRRGASRGAEDRARAAARRASRTPSRARPRAATRAAGASCTRRCSTATGASSSSTSRRSDGAVPERILYQDVITFPADLQDIAVVVDEDVEAGALVAAAREAAGGELHDARVFDVYQGDQVGAGKKSVAIHLASRRPTARSPTTMSRRFASASSPRWPTRSGPSCDLSKPIERRVVMHRWRFRRATRRSAGLRRCGLAARRCGRWTEHATLVGERRVRGSS